MIEKIDMKQYGYTTSEPLPDGLISGRVTEQHREQYTVITEHGETTAVLKGVLIYEAVVRSDLPCVGDFVLLKYNGDDSSVIERVLPRKSKFSRHDGFGHSFAHIKSNREQIVAVNFDYVFILSSMNYDFNVNRLMRYITQSRQSGGLPVVILTKADLSDNYEQLIAEVKNAAPDVPVHAISSHTKFGLSEIYVYLKPEKTVVILGMSGVGKSSLLNALMDREVMLVKSIREDDSRGRHTTTHRQLFMLPCGAMVIDTPGMRELGLFNADEGVSAGFADVEELFTRCRFNDCRHQTEPNCAVRAALEDGSLTPEHWAQYQSHKRESRFSEDKSNYFKEKQSRNKSIAKWSKKEKKNGGIRK